MTKRLLFAFVILAAFVGLGNRVVNRGGATAAWVDVVGSGSTNGNRAVSAYGEHWTDITLTTGNATKLRAYIRDYVSTRPLKLGLYNSSGTLLQQGSVSVTGTGYFEVTITSQAVTAGTYKISWVTDVSDQISFGIVTGTGTMYYTFSNAGHDTLLNPIPASDGSVSEQLAVGVYIE